MNLTIMKKKRAPKKKKKWKGKTNTWWIPKYSGDVDLIVPSAKNFARWLNDRCGSGVYTINGRRKYSGYWYFFGKIKVWDGGYKVLKGKIEETFKKLKIKKEREERMYKFY